MNTGGPSVVDTRAVTHRERTLCTVKLANSHLAVDKYAHLLV